MARAGTVVKLAIADVNLLVLQDVIQRVQGLEAMGRLSGVMDDRGKVRSHAPG